MMRHEHDSHGAQLRALDALTRNGVPPADACNTCHALYAGTRKLTDGLMEHIHLDNKLLFPAIPYCIDLLDGPRLVTDPAACVAFRPKSA
jgi:iron-sulfur cluster repair protein YtfE (RIC family)